MRVDPISEKLLRKIEIDDLVAYAQARHWARVDEPSDSLIVLNHPQDELTQILLPRVRRGTMREESLTPSCVYRKPRIETRLRSLRNCCIRSQIFCASASPGRE